MLFLLRVVHVVAGTFWAGAVIFIASFLMPTVRHLGAGGGPVMGDLAQRQRLSQWLLGAGILTILSGLGLYWRVSNGFEATWLHSGPGAVYAAGGLLALLAAILGVTVNSPTAKRLGAVMAARAGATNPPTPAEIGEVQRLQARLGRFTVLVAALLGAATLAMAVARYVP